MLVLMILCFVYACEGSHVLVVFSVPEQNHNILADSLVNALLDADYDVTYVTPHSKEARPNLEYVDISSILDPRPDEARINEADLPDDTSSPRYLPLLGTRFAQQVLKHPAMQELMMNTTLAFDAVLVEWFYTGLLAPLAEVFECPLIWFTPTDISWQSLSLVTNTPAHRLDLPPASLVDRVHHMWSQAYLSVWNYLYISRIEVPGYEKIYLEAFKLRRRFLPNYESVVTGGSFLLLNSQPFLGPAVLLPANVKYIGGHHIHEEVARLPKNLKKVMDSSVAGVIYVNMESNLINKNIQDQISRELKEAFSDLEQTVIWKYDAILVNQPHNVYTLKNPPQHSILNHVNTIAFINPGEMLSMLDATHFGVPVMALPLLEDQSANVNMMLTRGCGVSLGSSKDLVGEVKMSVKVILSNSSYLINAKKMKATFRHHLTSPRQEFVYWVETGIKIHGATRLRSSNLHTSTLERYNVDIILVVLMIFWFLTKVVKVLRVHANTGNDDHEKED